MRWEDEGDFFPSFLSLPNIPSPHMVSRPLKVRSRFDLAMVGLLRPFGGHPRTEGEGRDEVEKKKLMGLS